MELTTEIAETTTTIAPSLDIHSYLLIAASIIMAAFFTFVLVTTIYTDIKRHKKRKAFIARIQLNEKIALSNAASSNANLPKVPRLKEIKLPEVKGVIATRSWHASGHTLSSISQGNYNWENKKVRSDKIPTRNNQNGFYAYRLGIQITLHFSDFNYISGIVELSGKIIEHTDGVLRAEYCKILLLFDKNNSLDNISRKYDVPLLGDIGDFEQMYQYWLIRDGIKYLQHNSRLLDNEKPTTNMEELINQILREKNV